MDLTKAPERAQQAYDDGYLAHLHEAQGDERHVDPPTWDALTDVEQRAYVKFVQRVRYLDRRETSGQ